MWKPATPGGFERITNRKLEAQRTPLATAQKRMNRPDGSARLLVDVLGSRIFNILFVTSWLSGVED
jgi:hypothetical protein